jgi:membrane protein
MRSLGDCWFSRFPRGRSPAAEGGDPKKPRFLGAGGRASRDGKARSLEKLRGFAGLIKDAGVRWWDDNCLRLGASLAYYAIFSIFPLLLVAVTTVGFVLGHDAATRQRLLDAVASASSPAFRTLFDDTLHNMQTHETARGIGAVIGGVTLLLGASAVFSELETTLNQIWRVKVPDSTGVWTSVLGALKGKAFAFAIVVGAALAMLASLLISAALSSIDRSVAGVAVVESPTLWIVAETGASIAVLTGFLAAMFRMVPDTEVRWRDVLGGALLTALLFTGAKRLLAWYLGHLGSYAAYGAVGGFLGLLTWIYLASLFLFYGAEFTRVYAEKYGSLAGAQKGGDVLGGVSERASSVLVPEPGAYMRCDPPPESHGTYSQPSARRGSYDGALRENTR